ncbi:MAG TPA: hypothetical protein DDZ89_17135 [Clostridiales bacterium]|nr:hypothetical protein [Clostridiales bacterium]
MQQQDIIEGKYRIMDILGQGGSGTVYLAENIRIGNLWAVKEINHAAVLTNPLDEAYMMGKLYHPALPRVFDIYNQKNITYIVMEYFDGESMEQIIRDKKLPNEQELKEWALEICSVMMYLHNHKDGCIVYRDLKPGNIMILPDNSIRLIDFGIAREYKEETNSDTVYIGTKGFAAPEQFGNGQSDKRTDVYGFGITLYCLATGLLPDHKDFNPSAVSKDRTIPAFLKTIILKCIAVDPNNRYGCFEEILDEIKEADQNSIERKQSREKHNTIRDRKLITVWSNPEFASELAFFTAEWIEGDVLLADFDLLDAQLDLHLGSKMHPLKNKPGVFLSGIDILTESLYKGRVTRESIMDACIKIGSKNNLYLVTGNFNVNNYEYFSNECLCKFLDKCLKYFDEVIINVNRCIYDSYTLLCLMYSDLNIYAGKTDIASLRTLNGQIAFLEDKQKINSDKYKVVSWCEPKESMLPEPLLKDLSEQRYIGTVSDNKKRNVMRNDKKCFAKVACKNVRREYIHLLKKLDVIHRGFHIKRIPERSLSKGGAS